MVTDHLRTPFAAPTRAGTLLAGRYRFQELIATGGMVQVWKATDEVLNRTVAIKVLHDHLATDATFIARFRAEATSAARLNHRSIVAIYDTVSCDDTEAIVMELIDGATLRELLDTNSPIDMAEVSRIVSDVCEGLDVAHKAGVVHRDIKPSNILLATDGRVVVTDFGIAKAEQSAELTQTGHMMGTAKYLAPEQVSGHSVDGRSDLYSLGVVLYEAVCGRAPFLGETSLATAIARTQTEPQPPRQIRPACSQQLEGVILRAMQREPADRFATSTDLKIALQEALNEGGLPGDYDAPISAPDFDHATDETLSQSFARSERSWMIPVGAVLTISGALILAGLFFGGTSTGRGIVRDTAEVVGISDDTSTTETEVLPATEKRDPQPDSGPGGAVPIVAAAAFDPFGDGQEHGDKAAFAFDADPESFWRSERYENRLLGNLKPGVGIWVSVAPGTSISAIEIDANNVVWAVEVFIADDVGSTLEQWGDPVARSDKLADETRIPVAELSGGAVLVWITDLGDGPTPIRMEISEIRVIGV